MKTFNQEELKYYGLSKGALTSGELYEQHIDREYVDNKPNSINKENEDAATENKSEEHIEKDEYNWLNENAIAPQNYADIKPGEFLELVADQWHNGRLISKDTVFKVVSPPKKVRKIKKDDERESSVEYFVLTQTLLDTGEAVEIRLNIRDCKKADAKHIKDSDEDLKW